jgi:hypothetical protein
MGLAEHCCGAGEATFRSYKAHRRPSRDTANGLNAIVAFCPKKVVASMRRSHFAPKKLCLNATITFCPKKVVPQCDDRILPKKRFGANATIALRPKGFF